MTQQELQKHIREASKVVGKTWPLYAFVTSNPLTGYESIPFQEAARSAARNLGSSVFPETGLYKQAWDKGEISKTVLKNLLIEMDIHYTPEECLQLMDVPDTQKDKNENHKLDRIMSKWLGAFLDEGVAEWTMPGRENGFYKAWRKLAAYDSELKISSTKQIPATETEVLQEVLSAYAEHEIETILTYHLAALPGWTGYLNFRNESGNAWHQQYSLTLEEYLGVRLFIAKQLGAKILPKHSSAAEDERLTEIRYAWLKAWERSWQETHLKALQPTSKVPEAGKDNVVRPEAQFVFCIDTRSEAIRRHVESVGNYETFGYAGFFGIAMDYTSPENGVVRKSCPPILSSAYEVQEAPQEHMAEEVKQFYRKNEILKFHEYFLKRIKNMLPSAFGYVEGSGLFYGMSLLARTLFPARLYQVNQAHRKGYETICEPDLHKIDGKETSVTGIPLQEQAAIVKSAFDLTGWQTFAPLVLFVGHGSHSANNPFGSSLDCGACAASAGRHNARMLAKLANNKEVRDILKADHSLSIPENTWFIGGEHNTTTDEITLFDSEVPESHSASLNELKNRLTKVQQTATAERLDSDKNSVSLAQKMANNWAETRPEWGLAKNSGFVIGPRELTRNMHLGGHCFLHSYDWKTDRSGKALEGIMQGPMVVTQWINNHYYFSTVDNDVFGGGSKITHNVTGNFGVVQGNGGDLKMGLPLQSLKATDDSFYHYPLRLSVLIQAPLDSVRKILSDNQHLKSLLDNEWIYLLVMDPTENNQILRYDGNMQWMCLATNTHVAHELRDKQMVEV